MDTPKTLAFKGHVIELNKNDYYLWLNAFTKLMNLPENHQEYLSALSLLPSEQAFLEILSKLDDELASIPFNE